MTRKYPEFTADRLQSLINGYFIKVNSEPSHVEKPAKPKAGAALAKKQKDTESGPPTITGLAHFLGFSSLKVFDDYTRKGKFAIIIKRARLLIEAEYEKKLHQNSSGGAIFALKSLGWNEKPEEKATSTRTSATLKIEIHETGPVPASDEKEVVI